MLKQKTLMYEYLATQNIPQDERDFYNSMLTKEEKKYVEQLKLENQTLLDNHPFYKIKPALVVELMDQEKRKKKRLSFLRLMPVPTLVCLCLVLIIFITGDRGTHSYQSKGNNTSALFIYELVDDNEIKLLDDFSSVKSGAFLQLGYEVSVEKYGLIISVDSNRLITYHLKSGPGRPVLLTNLNEVTYLPYSYRLDNTSGFELFLFITSDSVFPVDIIIDYILAANDIAYLDFTQLETVTVEKILLQKESVKDEER